MPKGGRGKGRKKKGGGKKKKANRPVQGTGSRATSSSLGADDSSSSDFGYDDIPGITVDEYGRTLCAAHHRQECYICCMSFVDMNREIDENPSDRDVGVFISDASIIDWHAKMKIKMPRVFPEDDKVFGDDPGQHPYGTKLMQYFDNDVSKPMPCTIVGSRWKKDEMDLPGLPSYFVDGREPYYTVLMGEELTQVGLMGAHLGEDGWKVVGWEAEVNPRLDALARAHRSNAHSDDEDSVNDGSVEHEGSDGVDLSVQTVNRRIRNTIKRLHDEHLIAEPWDDNAHGDFFMQFFLHAFSSSERDAILNGVENMHDPAAIAEKIKAFPVEDTPLPSDKKNFYARVIIMQMIACCTHGRYGAAIVQNMRGTKYQAIELNNRHAGPDDMPLLAITYATDPEGIENPKRYLHGDAIKMMTVSNELAVVLEDHLLDCVSNEGLNDIGSGLLFHEGFLMPLEIKSPREGCDDIIDFAGAHTLDVNFGVELELSCASGNYHWRMAPALTKHAEVEVVRAGGSGKGGKGGAMYDGHFAQQKGYTKESGPSGPRRHDKWKIVLDKSIQPNSQNPHSSLFELVSPILLGTNGLAALSNMVNITTDVSCARVNDSMGLHVHVEAKEEDFSLQSMKSICQQFLVYEDVVDSFLPSHRRTGSDKCHSYFESNLLSMMASYDSLEESLEAIKSCQNRVKLYDMMNPGFRERYHKLNLQNLKTGRQPTIEFRQHHATTDGSEVVAWVRFCILFVVNAARMPVMGGSIPDDVSFDGLFDDVIKCPVLKEYYSRRR